MTLFALSSGNVKTIEQGRRRVAQSMLLLQSRSQPRDLTLSRAQSALHAMGLFGLEESLSLSDKE